jgi:hypothetical protein
MTPVTEFDRRAVVKGLLVSGFGAAGAAAIFETGFAQQIVREIHELKPGEFTWHPERSPAGPVAIVVSIPDQRVHVYRNGIRIAVSTCSSGKAGHSTPTGVFTILQKAKNHHSSTYNNAPMPNMNRLTWSGVALHAGNLPGYPASHGCVRLPLKFSELLFGVTHVGTAVIIAGDHSDPREVVHPGLVLPDYAEREMIEATAKLKETKLPGQSHEDNPTPATSVLISGADRKGFILENGTIVAEGPVLIANPETPLGAHVFILNDAHDKKGLIWHGIGHGPSSATVAVPEEAVIARIKVEQALNEVWKARLHPGMVLVTTDLPAHADTRTDRDFVVMTHDDA